MTVVVDAFAGLDWLEHAVFALDAEDRLRYANPAAEQWLGTSLRMLLDKRLPELFDSQARPWLDQALERARQQHAPCREYDIRLCTVPHRQQLHGNLHVIPLLDHPALPDGLLIELTAVDPQWKVVQEEQMARQQAANRELMRNLAHEIKNPLGGIRGAAQLLEHELADPALHEYTEVIRSETDRLQALLDRLLTRNPRPQPGWLNIHEVLERVRQLVSAETHRAVHFRCDYDASLPELLADRGQLVQVVLNIVKNAVQALNGQGEIGLRTRIARQVTLHRKRHGMAVQVDIIDSGPGIPPALQPQVFYPLVTGRAEGTGLGLSLAQSIVHQHGGTLDFESRPGHTVFTILLPVQFTPVAESA
ncbi:MULTISPECIES: nitrogen regulation protein NR(II) [Leeia]|uniref:Sensory histidine kinase/phosphatase NtrB n=1 Tax=Leeia aquatica TaxID=2725557 RepID=A0A847S4N2_9NEIS|nr:nitrogen regulation protein NR(II) [Leeia aquatica]NLR76701.1 PAS domain-containing protein [Leeia aquatica]